MVSVVKNDKSFLNWVMKIEQVGSEMLREPRLQRQSYDWLLVRNVLF